MAISIVQIYITQRKWAAELALLIIRFSNNGQFGYFAFSKSSSLLANHGSKLNLIIITIF
jgi:hypothetical protein